MQIYSYMKHSYSYLYSNISLQNKTLNKKYMLTSFNKKQREDKMCIKAIP